MLTVEGNFEEIVGKVGKLFSDLENFTNFQFLRNRPTKLKF